MAILMARSLGQVILLSALIMFVSPVLAASPQSVQMNEHKIKAGLVYNFLKYTSWPDRKLGGNGDRLRVCLLGGDPFDGYLSPLQGRTAQQFTIEVREIEDVSEAADCNMVFLHRDMKRAVPALLGVARERSVLTVSDMNGFSEQGGMVELSTQSDRRIHLFINTASVDASGLGIANRMLLLAELVK